MNELRCLCFRFQNTDLGKGRDFASAIGAFHRIPFAERQQARGATGRIENVNFLMIKLYYRGQLGNFSSAFGA
jgi:hypothetical protein